MSPAVRAGSATADITPEGAVPLGGYGPGERVSTGVHDPLAATALVVSDGGTTVAVVSLDLLNVSWHLHRRARERLVENGPVDEVILAATHTHAGPYVPAPAIDVNPLFPVEGDVAGIVDTVLEGIEESVRAARDALEPATIRVGRAENRETPINRRAAGGVGGGVRLPSGPIDPACLVLDVETESGAETLLYNVACHPVCTTPDETLVSADWPGYARDRLESATGATTLFCNGATADVNPRDRYAKERSGDAVYDYMAAIGEEIAETVLEARADARAADPVTAPLTAETEPLRLPVKSTPDAGTIRSHLDDLEDELESLRAGDPDRDASGLEADRTYARELLAIARWDATRIPARLSYVELGEIGLLGLPGEIFAEHGLAFKERAAVDSLLPIGYADGYVGYVPPLRELENGGYEVQTAKIAPEAVERLRKRATSLVDGS